MKNHSCSHVSKSLLQTTALAGLAATLGIAGHVAPAYAQANQAAQAPRVEEIVVTGSRIIRDGYEAPTPVTVVGVEEIQNAAKPNVFDAIATMRPGAGKGCLVFVTAHGERGEGLYLPAGGDDMFLDPARLDRALAQGCGEAPTVVVMSGCYSGIFARPPMTRANRVILTTFAISGLLAGVSGLLWIAQRGSVDPLMGFVPVLKAFIAAILGGIGNLTGAVIGGFALGAIEIALQALLPESVQPFRDAISLTLVVMVLLYRPQGLFGAAHSVRP